MMLVVVILQPKVIDKNNIEKLMAIILQPKVTDNNALEKSLVNFLIRN